MLLATAIVALAPVLCSTVFWPSVTAPVYVWLPVALTEVPFIVIVVALTVNVPRAEVLPNVPFSTTLPPDALIVKLSGVLSLFKVLPTVITAELAEATSTASPAKVTAPA